MSSPRLAAAQGLAVLALALALINDLSLVQYLGVSPMATGVSALLLGAAAFVLTLTKGSVLVTATLLLQGLANAVSAEMAGVTIGVAFGLVVLVLGAAEGALATRSMRKRAASR